MSDAPRRHRTRILGPRQNENASTSMWKAGTTWLQIAFVVLGLALTFGGWLLSMQFTLNSNSQNIQEITRTLSKMDEHFMKYDSESSDRGQRLSRIEAKIDVLMSDRTSGGNTTNFNTPTSRAK